MAQAEAGEFNLIVAGVESGKVDEAAKQFARAFSVDSEIAGQICRSAPIVFAQGLTKSEVKEVSSTLADLSKTGMEFRVTARSVAGLPRVHLPAGARFASPSAEGSNGGGFQWNRAAFVCPTCGETFLFQRQQQLKLG